MTHYDALVSDGEMDITITPPTCHECGCPIINGVSHHDGKSWHTYCWLAHTDGYDYD